MLIMPLECTSFLSSPYSISQGVTILQSDNVCKRTWPAASATSETDSGAGMEALLRGKVWP